MRFSVKKTPKKILDRAIGCNPAPLVSIGANFFISTCFLENHNRHNLEPSFTCYLYLNYMNRSTKPDTTIKSYSLMVMVMSRLACAHNTAREASI